MKPRALGLAALTLVALPTLATLAWFEMAYEESLLPKMRRTGLAPPPTIPEVNADDLSRMEGLYPLLADMSQPILPTRKSANLGLLGYFTPDEGVGVSSPVRVMRSSGAIHTLSMAFVTPAARSALIDGELHREGDELADGSVVRHIRPGQVILTAPDGSEQTLDILFPEESIDAARERDTLSPTQPSPNPGKVMR